MHRDELAVYEAVDAALKDILGEETDFIIQGSVPSRSYRPRGLIVSADEMGLYDIVKDRVAYLVPEITELEFISQFSHEWDTIPKKSRGKQVMKNLRWLAHQRARWRK
jgi:hypothetical protein